MPAYLLPGTDVGPRRARIIGLCAVFATVAACLVWRLSPESRPADEIRVELLTTRVGVGVEAGTDVRLDGVRIGSVVSITAPEPGRKSIELALTRSQLFGLTDAVAIDYAPGNLFGITTLQLQSRPGGVELADGSRVDLTDPESGRVRDATLSALLASTGLLTDQVLTPALADLLSTVSRDVGAFTPLLQAIGATARAYVETRQYPPSFLLAQYGSALAGLPPMLTGGLDLLEAAYRNEYFAEPANMARFREMFDGIQFQLLPEVTRTFTTAESYFAGLLPIATTILDQVSGSVGDPQLAADRLTELLDRLGGTVRDTPAGPAVGVAVELDTVPGLAMPLAAILTAPGGRR